MIRLIFVLVILGAGLALLFVNHDSGRTFGMDNSQFGQMIYLLPIAALLCVGVLAGNRGGFGQTVRQLAIWLVIVLGLVAGYLYRYDMQQFASRLMAGLMPGRAVVMTGSDGTPEVVISKSMNGHFEADAEVNGQRVHMLVDTGASSIVLSARDARAIGLDPDTLNYSLNVMTANGRTTAAPVTLDQVAVGPIIRRRVPALVAGEGRLGQSLLGMSFLSTISSLQIKTDELRLQD